MEFPRIVLPDGRTIDRPSCEWTGHQIRWRWLLDSWEGGEAYRQAVYGFDYQGIPIRNLIRHKREYPSVFETTGPQTGMPIGTDMAGQATDDDYELRRARTPVPTFVAEAVESHLSKIYAREVKREGPDPLVAWWLDVDGRGTTIDDWMAGTIAPLLLVLGQIDILCDRPLVPDGEPVVSMADERRLNLGTCVASYIMPENMLWWTLDRRGRYVECIMCEVGDGDCCRYRYWSATGWTLYDDRGNKLKDGTHGFGRVPIVRLFDRRRPRSRNIGLPRYEAIAEIQREFYNRDSELILSDTTQAHPLLQGPEDYVRGDGTVPVGPNWLLPKKKNTSGSSATYEGFDVIEFPKGGAESIRLNKADLRDAADRAACLTKPAGAAGTDGNSVGQSGVSKRLDATSGNELLTKIAAMLGKAEREIVDLALLAMGKPAKPDAVKVQYPASFDLFSAEELAAAGVQFQALLSGAGEAPETEGEILKKLVRLMLPGQDDDEYEEMDAEIEAAIEAKATAKEQGREMGAMATKPPAGVAKTDDAEMEPEDSATEED